MLDEYGLLRQLEVNARSPDGDLMCIYGDQAYPHRLQLQAPYRQAVLTPPIQEFNALMSNVCTRYRQLFQVY